ncbi:MAG: alcohol dehydrogenase catalytic domain-containing protein [Bryobacteraceae bacterium]
MRAVVLNYNHRILEERSIDEPRLESNTDVLFRICEVGVCGTDRDLAEFQLGEPPPGEDHLVLGHETLGQVLTTGAGVTDLKVGDTWFRWSTPLLARLPVMP